jgi:hypothetical protein
MQSAGTTPGAAESQEGHAGNASVRTARFRAVVAALLVFPLAQGERDIGVPEKCSERCWLAGRGKHEKHSVLTETQPFFGLMRRPENLGPAVSQGGGRRGGGITHEAAMSSTFRGAIQPARGEVFT